LLAVERGWRGVGRDNAGKNQNGAGDGNTHSHFRRI